MYSIGEFSRMNRITTKTLRHYDRIGLVRPAKVDDWTGYRYYSSDQLPVLRRILKLKELGFSLKEVKAVVRGNADLPVLLKNKKQEIQDSIQLLNRKLDEIADMLSIINGGNSMNTDVEIKSLPEVIVASMRTKVPGYDSYFDIVPKMGEYMKSVGAVCRTPEYCFTIYHDNEYRENDIDVEVCEAVADYYPESEKVKFKLIEGVSQAVCLIHQGPYSTIGETYNDVFSWMAENGYIQLGPPRESYIDGIWNCEDPQQWRTEVQVPAGKNPEGDSHE